mmetsp:Transcript_6921/g.17379  ORF Transcript_6921/g.17379 Transcript_6921/m.17379 type:complete len:94 (-) Transcript_6921:36-317(-)
MIYNANPAIYFLSKFDTGIHLIISRSKLSMGRNTMPVHFGGCDGLVGHVFSPKLIACSLCSLRFVFNYGDGLLFPGVTTEYDSNPSAFLHLCT